ncbi:MAG: hypothetical protein ACRCYP_07930 [Alphaproteobacteria bacterium]
MLYFNWLVCFSLLFSLVSGESLGDVSQSPVVSSPGVASPTHGISM